MTAHQRRECFAISMFIIRHAYISRSELPASARFSVLLNRSHDPTAFLASSRSFPFRHKPGIAKEQPRFPCQKLFRFLLGRVFCQVVLDTSRVHSAPKALWLHQQRCSPGTLRAVLQLLALKQRCLALLESAEGPLCMSWVCLPMSLLVAKEILSAGLKAGRSNSCRWP